MRRRHVVLLLLLAAALGVAAWALRGGREEVPIEAAPSRSADDDQAARDALVANATRTAAEAPVGGPRLTPAVREGLSIRGRILDDDGVGVAGATVTAVRDGQRERGAAVTTSAGDGAFVLGGLASGLHVLRAEHLEGARRRTADGLCAAGAEGVDLTLGVPPASFELVVLDAAGAPVPEVRLRAVREGSTHDLGTFRHGRGRVHASSGGVLWDAQGTILEIYDARDETGRGLPLAPQRVGPLTADPTRVEVRLTPGGLVALDVVGPPDLDLGGIACTLRREERPAERGAEDGSKEPSDASAFRDLTVRATLPTDGRLRLACLAPDGDHRLTLTSEDRLLLLPLPMRIRCGAPPPRVEIRRGVEVRLLVQDEEGAPVPLARVRAAPERAPGLQGERLRDAVADRDGRATLTGLDPGESYRLEVDPADPLEALRAVGPHTTAALFELRPTVLPRWRPRDQTIRLARGLVLEGALRHADGRPVVQARVTLKRGFDLQHDRTGPDGRFEFRALAPGDYELRATADGAFPSREYVPQRSRLRLEADRRDLVVTLPEARDVALTFGPREAADRDTWLVVREREGDAWLVCGVVQLGVLGSGLCVRGLPRDATYELVQWLGEEEYLRALVPPEAGSATFERVRGERIVVRIEPPGPHPRLEVACEDVDEQCRTSGLPPDAEGRFVFPGLPPGRYVVTASAQADDGTRLTARATAIPGQTVTLSLEQAGAPSR